MDTKIKEFDAIIYHGPCPDGTGGLWCACNYKPIKSRYACKAGTNPVGDYTGKNVIFIDICPKIDYLMELVNVANHVVILDHHESSKQMILDNEKMLESVTNLKIEFDMKRSGCQMAWDYFFDNSPRPYFIDYMGDRDLWKWELPHSKEINTALWELGYIDSYKLDKMTELFENSKCDTGIEFKSIEEMLKDPTSKLSSLKSIGELIEEGNKRQIDIGVANALEAQIKFEDKIYRIWLAGNINPILRSDLGNVLCSKPFKDGTMPDFSACWQFDPKSDEWWISFRGVPSRSPNLSIIASKYGGGGHSMACGITIKNSPEGLKKIFIY